jgi:hypothetical protein
MRDPVTSEEWQFIVDACQFLLCLGESQAYGLIDGVPAIDEARCRDLLERGAKLGYTPAPMHELLDRFTTFKK